MFISSHLMSEMAVTADHLIVIGRGRILADAPMDEVLAGSSRQRTFVRTDDAGALASTLTGAEVRRTAPDQLEVLDVPARRIAEAALAARILVTELIPQQTSLEDAYMELTRGEAEYQSRDIGQPPAAGPGASGVPAV